MSYTIWSHDRLLGETDLGWARCLPKVRSGHLHPTELGWKLVPLACGVAPALRHYSELRRALMAATEGETDVSAASTIETAYADLEAACANEEGLALELRDADGNVIPTKEIWVQDTEYLLSIADNAEARDREETIDRELGTEFLAEVKALLIADEEGQPDFEAPAEGEDEPMDFPRYQIHVRLVDEADVPWDRDEG